MEIANVYFENKDSGDIDFIFLEDYKNYKKGDIIKVEYWVCPEYPYLCDICGDSEPFVDCGEDLIELFENKDLFNKYLKDYEN